MEKDKVSEVKSHLASPRARARPRSPTRATVGGTTVVKLTPMAPSNREEAPLSSLNGRELPELVVSELTRQLEARGDPADLALPLAPCHGDVKRITCVATFIPVLVWAVVS